MYVGVQKLVYMPLVGKLMSSLSKCCDSRRPYMFRRGRRQQQHVNANRSRQLSNMLVTTRSEGADDSRYHVSAVAMAEETCNSKLATMK